MAEPVRTSQPAGPPSNELPNAGYLLESLVSDVHSLAQHVGTLTTMISASLRPDATWTLRSCRHLVHDDFKPLMLALRFSAQIGLGADVAARLTELCRQVGAAQARVVPMLRFSAASKPQRDQIQTLSVEWRRLASSASATLTTIEPFVHARLDPSYAEDLAALRVFLTQAADPGAGAADAAGIVKAPVLKQRRRVPRIAVNAACSLETPSSAHSARLEDVSRHGFGIVCDALLSAGETVTVTLADGRRLSASVVRSQRPRFGLRLAAPLSDCDPLFAGEARRVS